MNNEALITLLRIISANGSLAPLTTQGFTYSQIAGMLQELLSLGYTKMVDDVITLNDKGKNVISEYYTKNKLRSSDQWIMPQKQYHIKPIGKYDIVFPNKI